MRTQTIKMVSCPLSLFMIYVTLLSKHLFLWWLVNPLSIRLLLDWIGLYYWTIGAYVRGEVVVY